MITYDYEDLTFEFSPDGKLTEGELEVFKGDESFGAKLDLASIPSRSKWINAAVDYLPDVFEDDADLKRGVVELYSVIKEKKRFQETAEDDPDDEIEGLNEEDVKALIATPGVLERYVEDVAEANAVHADRLYMKTIALCGFSAQLDLVGNQPLGTHVVLTGESSRGKNYLTDAVASGMPETFVYAFESASSKSFYYHADAHPERFKHTWIYPNEAEATDALIETLRPLLSKGSAVHGTVDENSEGVNTFRSMRIEGPITITIPTVRNKLDGQLQTRMLTVELEDFEGRIAGQTEKFADTLLPEYASQNHADKLKAWNHALSKLTDIRRVVLPGKVKGFRFETNEISHGARLWRNLLSLMLTHAWLEQRNRDTVELEDGETAVIVDAEDYRVAYELFRETAKRSVRNLSETHKRICQAVYDLQQEKKVSHLHGKGFSERAIAKKTGFGAHRTVQQHRTYLVSSERLLYEAEKGGLLLVEGAEPSWWEHEDTLKGLPKPEDVREWWEAVAKVATEEENAEKPIDKPNEVATSQVAKQGAMATEVATKEVATEKPIDKPNEEKNEEVATVATSKIGHVKKKGRLRRGHEEA